MLQDLATADTAGWLILIWLIGGLFGGKVKFGKCG